MAQPMRVPASAQQAGQPAGPRIISREALRENPNYQAYQVLHFAYTMIPLTVGTDKFFHVLTNWDQYLAPFVPQLLGVSGHRLMLVSGCGELIVGIGVAVKPRIFAYLASAWLFTIVFNLLLTGRYFDIALRDFGLSAGALALARISAQFD
jgi:hypothetical protein